MNIRILVEAWIWKSDLQMDTDKDPLQKFSLKE